MKAVIALFLSLSALFFNPGCRSKVDAPQGDHVTLYINDERGDAWMYHKVFADGYMVANLIGEDDESSRAPLDPELSQDIWKLASTVLDSVPEGDYVWLGDESFVIIIKMRGRQKQFRLLPTVESPEAPMSLVELWGQLSALSDW